ncbi:hypothetical protein DK870_13555 [Pseudomonas sp. Q1]|nr:hypothetical protein [Pseudomonas sp. Q1]
MLAKNVNDNAFFLDQRGACEFFASKLAPTQSLTLASLFSNPSNVGKSPPAVQSRPGPRA